MPYVTESYYTDTFYGEAVTPSTDFAKYEARAEDVINMVTRNRISDIDSLPPSIAELVRKAVCAQIEWYVWNGVETSITGLSDMILLICSIRNLALWKRF